MKGSIAAAAVIGSVAAAAHNGHAAFHLRGDYATQDVCTVYTTVYVYPSGALFELFRLGGRIC